MANNDIIYNDASATPQSFLPESIDAGTAVGTDNVTRKVRRTSVGILLGSFIDFGPNTDVANAADTPTTSGLSFLRRFSNAWAQLVAVATGIGTPADAAWTGTGGATLVALFKAVVGQATPTSVPGTSLSASTQVPAFQGVTGGIPVPTTGPAVSASGTLTNSGDTVVLVSDGMSTLDIEAIGPATWTGSTVIEIQPLNSTLWYATSVEPFEGGALLQAIPPSVASQLFTKHGGGIPKIRVRATTAITNGPLTINLSGSQSTKGVRVSAPVSNPVPVVTPLPAAPIAGQIKIATTGIAVALPSKALLNGVVIKANQANAANGFVGPSGVTTTYDGTGSGYPVEPGAAASFAVANSSSIYVNGTAGDVFSYAGN